MSKWIDYVGNKVSYTLTKPLEKDKEYIVTINKTDNMSASVLLDDILIGETADNTLTFISPSSGYSTISFAAETELNIEWVQLEKGNKATDWTPAPEDKADQSQITKLEDNINLRVSKGELLSQINVQAGGVLITSGTNKLNITPTTTYIQNATIKSAMIHSIDVNKITGITADFTSLVTKGLTANVITSTMIKADDAMFTKLFATSLATDKLVAQGAWITDANIVSLDAGTITSGTINAARLDAKSIVTSGLDADVVKSTHIKAESGLVGKLFSTTAYIEELTNKTVFTEKIQAISISADKITTGTLDASKVSVVNLDANNITANKTEFIQSNWNGINSSISIDANGIRSANFNGDWTLYHAGAVSFGGGSSQGIYLEYAEGARNGLAINNRGALNTEITLDLRSSARNTINFGRRTDTNGYDFRIDHYQGSRVSFDGRGVSRYTFNVNSDAQSHAISILGHGATSGYNDGSGLSIGLETADGRAKGSRFYFSSNSDLVWLSKNSFNDLKPLAVSDLQFRWGESGRKSMKEVLERLSQAVGVDINNIPDVY